jgi:pimeloyl-ACP methyl ester carboxylesterase
MTEMDAASHLESLADALWHDWTPWTFAAFGKAEHVIEVALTDQLQRRWRHICRVHPEADGALRLRPRDVIPFLKPADPRGYWQAVARDPSVLSRPVLPERDPVDLTITLRCEGKSSAIVQRRSQVAPDAPAEVVATADGARGLFFPASAQGATSALGIGLVTLPGSGGGLDAKAAALLAADGFDVLALGLFAHADLPESMARLRIEHVAAGILWLRARLGHERIGLRGISKGSEAAAWTAILHPDLVKALILWVPSPMATSGRGADGKPTALFTFAGRDLPWGNAPFPADASPANHSRANPFAMDRFFAQMWRDPANAHLLLPVERVRCPVLLVSGDDDGVWPSQLGAAMLAERLAAANHPHAIEHVMNPRAGHLFNLPLAVESCATVTCHPVQRWWLRSGGTPRANAQAADRSWEALRQFLCAHLSAQSAPGDKEARA